MGQSQGFAGLWILNAAMSSQADGADAGGAGAAADENWGASTLKALQSVNRRAATLLERDEPPTAKEVTELFASIGDANWPTQNRPNVGGTVRGMCLGLVYGLGGQGFKVSKVSESFGAFTALVTRFIATSLPEDARGRFTFSSVQINYNYAAKRHVDGNNVGPSYIIALGEHTGGGLWTADRGVVQCRHAWAAFDGTVEHETRPFDGQRVSLIAFTNNGCEELTAETAAALRALGFSKGSSERLRDPGAVDEAAFDAWFGRRPPPPAARGAVAVDCAGYACGRGSAWFAFQPGDGPAKPPTRLDCAKNSVGLHVLELEMRKPITAFFGGGAAGGGDDGRRLTRAAGKANPRRYDVYNDASGAVADEFCARVRGLPPGRVVVVTIADSAIAKTRPLPPRVYDALRALGAPRAEEMTTIGYRNPFAFIGVKGAPPGSYEEAFAIDVRAQSKCVLRVSATVVVVGGARGLAAASSDEAARAAASGGVVLRDVAQTRASATRELGAAPVEIGKTAGGRPVYAPAPAPPAVADAGGGGATADEAPSGARPSGDAAAAAAAAVAEGSPAKRLKVDAPVVAAPP